MIMRALVGSRLPGDHRVVLSVRVLFFCAKLCLHRSHCALHLSFLGCVEAPPLATDFPFLVRTPLRPVRTGSSQPDDSRLLVL